ncbi:MAG: hypothetical protein ACI4WY_00355 [Anaerovoracaceae bacterium]
MERIFFRERTVWEDKAQLEAPVWNLSCRKEKKKIAVVGISRGAGTTFVAMSLAFLLSKNVEKEQVKEQNRGRSAGLGGKGTFPEGRSAGRAASRAAGQPGCLAAGAAYVELRQPAAGEAGGFFSAGLDLRFRRNRFTDFFQIYLQGRPLPPRVNLHKGINWVVWRTPTCAAESAEADADVHLSKIDASLVFPPQPSLADFPLEQLAGEWIIADNPPLEMLHRFDLVIGVIDPLPSRVFAGTETYEALRDLGTGGVHTLWILNGDNPEVNHGELRRFLRLKDFRTIPLADSAVFYRAQYACCLPVELLAADSRHESGDSGSRHAVYAALKALAEEVAAKWKEAL